MPITDPLSGTKDPHKHVSILGIRGVPARHGGFETFAEHLAIFLVSRGWQVTVYCQEEGTGSAHYSEWRGIELVHVPSILSGSAGSILFDLKSMMHSISRGSLFLILGYNTAIFNLPFRLWRRPHIINMDGIEWRRQKWGRLAKAWFWINERVACRTATHLVADNPGIEAHLRTRVSGEKITMIPYGANPVLSADESLLVALNIEKYNYALVVARIEPENSILEIVTAFSGKERGVRLVVLGEIDKESNAYHRAVLAAAGKEVIFPGPIYDQEKIASLRFYSKFNVHGHQVGGTNPTLVEALGAGNAVVARDNIYNRWVAGDAALYFDNKSEASAAFDTLLSDNSKLEELRCRAREIFAEKFKWEDVLIQYERLLDRYRPDLT